MEYQRLSIKDKDDGCFEIDEDIIVKPPIDERIMLDDCPIECREDGIFEDKALYLPKEYDYILGVDDLDEKILVVLKKKGVLE